MSNYMLILTEGEIEEVDAINSLNRNFLNEEKMHIISFKTNIYTLYKQLKQDDFETDIVEVLKEENAGKDILCEKISIHDIHREEISEIYLIFDYDAHHYGENIDRSIAELKELVDHFENETEQGKLYLSYPMIEALNYHNPKSKDPMNVFYFPYDTCYNAGREHFKKMRHPHIAYRNGRRYESIEKDEWRETFKHFLSVIHYTMDGVDYAKISPNTIFEAQLKRIEKEQMIFILSAIPSLVIEYFGRDFYNQLVAEITFKSDFQVIQL